MFRSLSLTSLVFEWVAVAVPRAGSDTVQLHELTSHPRHRRLPSRRQPLGLVTTTGRKGAGALDEGCSARQVASRGDEAAACLHPYPRSMRAATHSEP